MREITLFEPFALDSGLTGPLRLTVQGPGNPAPEVREFRHPFVVVGREAPADLVLNHPDVSRRHAYLQVFAGRLFAVDLDSRTGLCWRDGSHLSGWVSEGESVRIGPYEIRPQIGPDDRATRIPPPTSREFPLVGAQPIALEVTGAGLDRKWWQLRRALVLFGRANGCRLRLGPDASRFHTALVRTPTAAWMVDLLAPGGFTVNGEAAHCTRLADGDEIRINHYRIAVRLGEPLAAGVAGQEPLPTSRPLATRVGVPDPVLSSVIEEFGRMQDQMSDQFQQALLGMFRLFTGMHQDQMTLIRDELARLHELTAEQQALLARLAAPPSVSSLDSRPNLRIVAPESSPPPDVKTPSSVPTPRRAPDLPPLKGDAAQVDMHQVLIQRLAAIDNERQGRWQKLLSSCLKKNQELG